jgi:hypothetical protein
MTAAQQRKHADYDGFVEKFKAKKPKKTTDDCYTPPNIYDAVLEFARAEYGKRGAEIVRPFFPGGDYENAEYPEGCVVVDNPPFSILAKIVRFYEARGVAYFLFAPHLTCFSVRAQTTVLTGVRLYYENGAQVNTSFVANLGDPGVLFRTTPALRRALKSANDENRKRNKKPQEKLAFPRNVVTAARVNEAAMRGVQIFVRRDEAYFTRNAGKTPVFGGGYIVSDAAAARMEYVAEKAAEKAAEIELSPEQKEIAARLSAARRE